MKTYLVLLAAGCAAGLAQPSLSPPAVGTIRDTSGALHTVIGMPGNFVVLDSDGISNATSAAFSAVNGLIKTETELLVLDGSGQIARRYQASAGGALFAFDPDGGPALVYSSGILSRFGAGEIIPVNWSGDAVSIASAGARSASIIVRRDDGLWTVQIALLTGNIESETQIAGVNPPVMLLAGGDLLFTRDGSIVVRDNCGWERQTPAGFEIDSFEQMGKDWITVRESGGGRLFALHVTPQNLDLYQLPEVTQ